jgi:hypothetical protein
MPGLDRLEATRRLAADPAISDVRTLILTPFDLDEYLFERSAPAPADSSSKTQSQAICWPLCERSPEETRSSRLA